MKKLVSMLLPALLMFVLVSFPAFAAPEQIQMENLQQQTHAVRGVVSDAMGPMAGVDVVVTSKHVGCYDPEMMRALGVEPSQCKCIVVKLGYLEPEIRAIAKRSIMALSDGSSNEIFTRLPYKHITRPLYPLDPDASCSFSFIGR